MEHHVGIAPAPVSALIKNGFHVEAPAFGAGNRPRDQRLGEIIGLDLTLTVAASMRSICSAQLSGPGMKQADTAAAAWSGGRGMLPEAAKPRRG